MLCILYVNLVGALMGVVGHLVDRAMPATWSRRWMWCVIIALSVILPPISRTNHTAALIPMIQNEAVTLPLPGAPSLSLPPLGAVNPTWLVRGETFGGIIQAVWFYMTVLLIFWGTVSVVRVWYIVRAARKDRTAHKPAMLDGVPVLLTDSIGPATVGIWRSRVLVPRWVLALPKEQRQYVIRHEDEHRKGHDARLLFIASLPLLLLPWNLGLWWQLRRLALAVEMDCDNRVVAALGDAPAYGQLLFRIAELGNTGPRLQPAFLGAGMLERRLRRLLVPTQLRRAQRFLLPVLACALLAAVLSMPHPILGNGLDETGGKAALSSTVHSHK